MDKLDIDQLKNAPSHLSNLKSKVDKLDVHKLVPVPIDLSKLSDVVKNDVVKKDVCNAKIKYIEDKIPDINNLATNTTFNAKRNEVKNEILSIINIAAIVAFNSNINEAKINMPHITNLATTAALTAIENKIPDHRKYITTPEFNKLTAENFAARLAQANLASKSNIANFVKKADFDDKLKKINELSDKVKEISTKGFLKDSINKYSIPNRVKYFSSGIFQSYLVFIPTKKHIKYFSGTTRIYSWKSNGMSKENIENITK